MRQHQSVANLPTIDKRFIDDYTSYRCRKSFYEFSKHAWHVIEPGIQLIDNWHIKAVCDHLQAVSDGKIKRLIVNMPPGFCKSMLVSVMWQAWEWIDHPDIRWIFGAYEERLALRDSDRCRSVMESEWYQDTFRPEWTISKATNAKGYFRNSMFGHRFSYGVGSRKKTGWRANRVIVDDPLSVDDRYNEIVKKKCVDTWNVSLSTRVNDPKHSSFIITGHRVAYDDLCGIMFQMDEKRIKDGKSPLWEHLNLPARFHPERKSSTSIGWEDPRTEEGELLFETLFPDEILYDYENALGAEAFACQFDQNPSPEEGGRFRDFYFWEWVEEEGREDSNKRQLIRLIGKDGYEEIIRIDLCEKFCSVDVASSEKRTADYTVFMLFAKTRKNQVVFLARWKGRMAEPDAVKQAKAIHQVPLFGRVRISTFIVEENGVGMPLARQMERAGLPVRPVFVHKDKIAMSTTIIVRMEAGDVFYPDPSHTEWMTDCMITLKEFPMGSHDDDVTAVSLAAEGIYGADVRGEVGAVSPGEGHARKRAHEIVNRGMSGGADADGTNGPAGDPLRGATQGERDGRRDRFGGMVR